MFPEEEFIFNESTIKESNSNSFAFDFTKGDFVLKDGKLIEVDKLEALKVWITKALKTEKYKFKIYDSYEYGTSIKDLISGGYSFDFVKVELEREITEAIKSNPYVTSVGGFSFLRDSRGIICNFRVESNFGDVESEVIL